MKTIFFIMNLAYNWLVNYTHSNGKIIIPLKESSNDKGACICIIEAVALGIWLNSAYTSECMCGLATTTPISQRLGRSGEQRGWSTTQVESYILGLT